MKYYSLSRHLKKASSALAIAIHTPPKCLFNLCFSPPVPHLGMFCFSKHPTSLIHFSIYSSPDPLSFASNNPHACLPFLPCVSNLSLSHPVWVIYTPLCIFSFFLFPPLLCVFSHSSSLCPLRLLFIISPTHVISSNPPIHVFFPLLPCSPTHFLAKAPYVGESDEGKQM